MLIRLASFGDRVALFGGRGSATTFSALATSAARVAQQLGERRRLVLIEADDDVEPIATYLGARAGGHPVLLTQPAARNVRRLVEVFDPDVVAGRRGGTWRIEPRRVGTRHELHPDLALLLSTSGTTGSPKLVRLSSANLDSNAHAIAGYLRLGPDDRAITTLPMGYCYGLSVINSHLAAGASIILSTGSVVDRCFWDAFGRFGATSFAGVPHTFDLLDRVGFESMDLPTLRYLTQAGGRLAPDTVRRYAALGRRRGWQLFVMYGQTEATARMAFLPPELAETHPASIGRPIPGGEFRIESTTGDPSEGELVYRGPNVMLGYARSPADLALGRAILELRTGDLARRTPEGIYEITGRSHRFLKLYGLRVDLDQAERVLADLGHRALCTGTDDGLVVATTSPDPPRAIAALAAGELGLPARTITVVPVETLPRLESGKPDYRTVRTLAAPPAAGDAGAAATGAAATASHGPCERHPIDQVFADVLGVEHIGDADTFVSLGGDSLSYVEVSLRLERLLGEAPESWHTTAVGELRRRAPRRRRPTFDTTVALRAVAIGAVLCTHTGFYRINGGAHLLLAVAGYNFARFTLSAHELPHRLRRGLTQIGRLALPTAGYVAAATLLLGVLHPAPILLVSTYTGQGAWRHRYWFVELVVHLLVLLLAAFSIPALRTAERRRPFAVALAALAAAWLASRYPYADDGIEPLRTHASAWLFVLGWAAQRSTTARTRLVVSAIVVLAVPEFLAGDPRLRLVLVGVLVLVWAPRLMAPVWLHRPLSALAGASLALYLTHWQVVELLAGRAPSAVVLALSLAVGLAAWHAGQGLARASRRWRRRLPPARLDHGPREPSSELVAVPR